MVQTACVPDPAPLAAQGKTLTLSFRDSLAAPRRVSCPAGSIVHFTNVVLGHGEAVTKASGAGPRFPHPLLLPSGRGRGLVQLPRVGGGA